MQNKDEEVGLLALAAELLLGNLDILLELAHGILEGSTGVIDLIDNQNILANQVGHLEGAHVEPLCAGDLGTGDLLGITTAKILVERETDGLDGNVGVAGALEERSKRSAYARVWFIVDVPENASRDVTTTTDGDHQVGVEVLEDVLGRGLAQFVDLLYSEDVFVLQLCGECRSLHFAGESYLVVSDIVLLGHDGMEVTETRDNKRSILDAVKEKNVFSPKKKKKKSGRCGASPGEFYTFVRFYPFCFSLLFTLLLFYLHLPLLIMLAYIQSKCTR